MSLEIISQSEIKFNPKNLIFDYKVREACKNCKRYSVKATCPPFVESVDYYKKVLKSYKKGIFIIIKFNIDNPENWKQLGSESTNYMNNSVLNKRNQLISDGHYFCIGFGAGSCKNCEKCSFPCRMPDKSLIPIEATGVDVVKSIKKHAKINFPVKKHFFRIGVILYD